MVKRVCCALFALIIVFAVVPAANAVDMDQTVIRFPDGSYLVSEVMPAVTRTSGRISGSKPYTYYDANGRSQWEITLRGTFSYTGSSAVCTDASVSITIYNNAWYTISKNTKKEGDSAIGAVTMGGRVTGSVSTVPVSLRLTCDANGNLS